MIRNVFNRHFEWLALCTGLVLMATMNPYTDHGTSLCLFELLDVPFCPGEGLGHSIAFFFRGDFTNAISAHPVGPASVFVLSGRIVYLWKQNYFNPKTEEIQYGKDDRLFT